MMRRLIWPSVVLALVVAYPLLFSSPFQQRLGALVLLYAIAASAWFAISSASSFTTPPWVLKICAM